MGDDEKASDGVVNQLLWEYFQKRWYYIVIYVLLSLFYPVRVLIIPYWAGKVTSIIEEPGFFNPKATRAAWNGMGPEPVTGWAMLKRPAMIVLALWAIALVMQISRGVFDSVISPEFQEHVRSNSLSLILKTYSRNYRELETGDINVKLYQLPRAAHWAIKTMVNQVIPTLGTLLIAQFMFFRLHWKLGMLFFIFILLIAVMYALMTIVLYPAFQTDSERLDELHEEIDDFIGNLLTLCVSNTTDIGQGQFDKINGEVRDARQKMLEKMVIFRAFTTVIKYMFIAGMLYMVGRLRLMPDSNKTYAMSGAMFPVASALFVTMSTDSLLYDAVINYMQMLDEAATITKTENYFDSIATHSVDAPDPKRRQCNVANGKIVIQKLTVKFDTRPEPAIDDVDLVIENSERLVLTGHVGSGKSTLVRTIMGLHPYIGNIQIGGQQVRDLSSSELHDAITFVPQQPKLFNKTIMENIRYGYESAHSEAEIERLIASLNIPDFPPLTKMAGKGGSNLSGGQRAVVCLVRGAIRQTPIVILDEPTAALDTNTKENVRQMVNQLFATATIIVITHDHSIDWATPTHPVHHVSMNNGKIASDTTN